LAHEHDASEHEFKPAVLRVDLDPVAIETTEIPRIPLLSALPPRPFHEVLQRLELEAYPAGTEIKTRASVDALDPDTDELVAMDEPALHILVTGRVNAELLAEDGTVIQLGEVELGSFFGE